MDTKPRIPRQREQYAGWVIFLVVFGPALLGPLLAWLWGWW